MGIFDTLKKLFGGGQAPAETEAPVEEAPTEETTTEEAPAEEEQSMQ